MVRMGTYEVDGPRPPLGLQWESRQSRCGRCMSMTALSGDITLPLVSRWFGRSRGLGEGRLSTPACRLPVETRPPKQAHDKACEVCECDRSCLGSWGPGAGVLPQTGRSLRTPTQEDTRRQGTQNLLLGLPGPELQPSG